VAAVGVINSSRSNIKNNLTVGSAVSQASLTIALSPGGRQITMSFATVIGSGLAVTDISGVPNDQQAAWCSIANNIAQNLSVGTNLGSATAPGPSPAAMLAPAMAR
jgi:hypothetical protein